ncbi:3-oxo-tetronate kinase [Ruicaihuangia caeni]|uniref:3-oxo-tetronate kinase n=1 Tax=Ruicaihuangia caeni TaxID=3042517 RepID=A0AAW6TBR3_9MICO|nr:3-oxo-tetronate kinase [Klugiella sp. YN-L-19]MDI2099430.1 four-carbon acid sugar kinase family protein [Klugiella sp. YN-L-19]
MTKRDGGSGAGGDDRAEQGGVMIGAIADDFTGATDLASNLVRSGYRAVVVTDAGAVCGAAASGADAIVVALKSRTAPVADAVSHSLDALTALRDAGSERVYFKYCSTFDSTPEGTIGPVLDALMEALDVRSTIVVPSFPANGRTVYKQHLFVHGELLEHSPMRHHPLTPMTRSNVIELLQPQSGHRVLGTDLQQVHGGASALAEAWQRETDAEKRTVFVVDAVTDADLHAIAAASASMPLISGGSGLALGLRGPHGDSATAALVPAADGRRVVLAGSASAATRGQIAHALERSPGLQLDIAALKAGFNGEIARVVDWARGAWNADESAAPVVYATGPADQVDASRDSHTDDGALIERALAELAQRFVEAGVRHLLVAGGETSGAVVAALGVSALEFGGEISPGVAWVSGSGAGGTRVNLALKSGNFGRTDMFTSAWGLLP